MAKYLNISRNFYENNACSCGGEEESENTRKNTAALMQSNAAYRSAAINTLAEIIS